MLLTKRINEKRNKRFTSISKPPGVAALESQSFTRPLDHSPPSPKFEGTAGMTFVYIKFTQQQTQKGKRSDRGRRKSRC